MLQYAIAGGLIALKLLNLVTYQSLDLLTMIGFIILLGLVVNNAILLVDQTRSDQDNLVATGKLATYQEITESNRDSFHFHGDQTDYPLTAVLFAPDSDKSSTLARA